MVHPMTVTAANRLAMISNFGTFLNRWQCSPFNRMEGTTLTQFRTVRRGGGDRRHSAEFEDGKGAHRTEEGNEQRREGSSASSSSSHFRFSASSDREKVLHEFNKEFARFLRQFSWSRDKKGEEFDERLKAFIREFNKQMSELEVERTNQNPKDIVQRLFFAAIGLTILSVFIFYRLVFRNAILPEHRAVVSQQHSAVSFDEFVQHFLAAGEVRMIYFYPNKSIAVAVLQPGAIIRGQPFYGSTVLIRLDPYTASGTHFLQGIEDAQNRLGIEPREHVPVAIHFPSSLPMFMLVLAWLILFGLFFNYAKNSLRQQMFRVKRKKNGGGESK